MVRLTLAGLMAAVLLGAPAAGADSNVCVGSLGGGGCTPGPWNGQQMQTWNTPGYYGGWTNGPVLCDPFTTRCRGVAVP